MVQIALDMTEAQVSNDPKSDYWSLFISRNSYHENIGNDGHQHDMYGIKAVEINLYQNAKDRHIKVP